MINYGDIDINEGGLLAKIICGFGLWADAVVIHNRIFFNSKGSFTPTLNKSAYNNIDDYIKAVFRARTFIHELVHVWQYKKKLLTVRGGFWTHLRGKATYEYFLFPEKEFHQSGFEQQAK